LRTRAPLNSELGTYGRVRRLGPRAPWPLVPFAVIAVAFLVLPLVALLQRIPWTGLRDVLHQPVVTNAVRLSLVSSLLATAVALLLGIPLAWVLARMRFRGRSVLRALVLLPMVLPPVVGGAALLFALGRRGLLGEPLYDGIGVLLPFSIWGVVVANAFVAMPFLVITVEAGLRSVDQRYEDAAATLGATQWTTFRRVTAPMAAPSIVAGTVLCWARALGEFGATITFAGSLQGKTQTMPIAIYLRLEQGDRNAALAMSLVLIVVSLAVLVPLRDRWLAA
jgi:molybdate transport system permease protein